MVDSKYNTKWDLKDYYNSVNDPELDSDVEKISDLVDEYVSKFKGKIVGLDENELLELLRADDEIDFVISKISIYLLYVSSLDTQNQDIIRKQAELSHRFTDISNKLLFVSQEFKERGYDNLIELSNSEVLKPWKNYFFQKAQSIKYILDEKTEFALNLKDSSGGSSAFSKLYEEFTSSFMYKMMIDGEEKDMTEDEVRSLRTSADKEVRKQSFEVLRETYNTDRVQIALGNCYSNIVKDWTSELKLRGFETVMDQRNISEQMDNEVIDLLLSEVSNSNSLFERYVRAKAKVMNGPNSSKLDVWDVMAPLGKVNKEYSFDEGMKLFLDVIGQFDKEFYDYSKEMFDDSRVDVFPSKGKRGGAYACFHKGFKSFVLLNWTNKLRDVSTLAHELGHATHGMLSQGQKQQVYSSALSLAETASIFNEMVLSERLVAELDESEKLAYFDERLNDVFATIHRQIQYVQFERRCHQMIADGSGLTYEDFNKIWREEQVRMTGDTVDYHLAPEKESTWSMIPHIFRTPFYCYSYSFGNLLTFALYEKYREEGNSFIEKYKDILRAGGSVPPRELLLRVGLDIAKPEFYRGGLKVVERMVCEFEEIIEKLK